MALLYTTSLGTCPAGGNPASMTYSEMVNSCRPFDVSPTGAILYGKITCSASDVALSPKYSDAACLIEDPAANPPGSVPPPFPLGCSTQPCGSSTCSANWFCNISPPSASATPSNTPTGTPTQTPSTTPSAAAGTASNTPTSSDTPSPTSSPSNTPTPSNTPSNSPSSLGTASNTPTPTPPPTPTPTPTPSPAAGSGRGYVLQERFTDAACTSPFLTSSIMAPSCQPPFSSSSTLYVGIFCNGPYSAQYNGYTDPNCAGPSQGLASTISQFDGQGNALASWACSQGADGAYYRSSCVVSAAMPAQYNPSAPEGSTSVVLVQSANSGSACPNTAPVTNVFRVPTGQCGPISRQQTGGSTYVTLYSKATCDGSSATLGATYSDAACSVLYSSGPGASAAITQPLGCSVSTYSTGAGGGSSTSVATAFCNGAGGSVVLPGSPSPTGAATPTPTPTQTPSRTQASASTPPTYSSTPSNPPKSTSAARVCGGLESYDRAVLLLPAGAAAAAPGGCTVNVGSSYSRATTDLAQGGLCRALVGVCTRPANFCGEDRQCVGVCATSCAQSPGVPVGPTYYGCPPGVALGSVFSLGSTMSASDVAAYAANYVRGGQAPGGLGFDYSQLALTVVLCNPSGAAAGFCGSNIDAGSVAAPGSDVAAVANCPAGAYVAPSPSALASTSTTATYTQTAAAGASPTGTPRPTPAVSPSPSTSPLYAATTRTCAFLQDWQRALVPVPQPQPVGVPSGCWVTDIDASGQESRTQQNRPPGALCTATAGVCTGAAPGSSAWCVGTCQVGGAASGAFYWGCPTNVPSGSLWVNYQIWDAAKVGTYAAAYRTGGSPGIALAPGTAAANVVVAACNGAYSSACDPNTYASGAAAVLQCPVGQPAAGQALGSSAAAAPAAAGLSPGGTAGLVIGLLLLLGGLGLFFIFRGLVAAYWKRRLTGGKEAIASTVVVVNSPMGYLPQQMGPSVHVHIPSSGV